MNEQMNWTVLKEVQMTNKSMKKWSSFFRYQVNTNKNYTEIPSLAKMIG